MEFNEYLKELRSKKFADTNKLSKLLKVSRNMWQKIESGINPPPRRSLLVDFCRLILCKEYEKNQLFALARRWRPSKKTNTSNHIITPAIELMMHYKPEEYQRWYEAAIEVNTPDSDQFAAGDINSDGILNVLDIVNLVNMILQ